MRKVSLARSFVPGFSLLSILENLPTKINDRIEWNRGGLGILEKNVMILLWPMDILLFRVQNQVCFEIRFSQPHCTRLFCHWITNLIDNCFQLPTNASVAIIGSTHSAYSQPIIDISHWPPLLYCLPDLCHISFWPILASEPLCVWPLGDLQPGIQLSPFYPLLLVSGHLF